jgi:TP901 family phage tail tape measure protein
MSLSPAGVTLIAQGIGEFVSNMGKADKAVTDFGDSGSKSTGAASQIMTGALRQVGAGAVDLAVKGVQAVGDFVTGSIAQAGDFEAGMNQFQIAVGKTIDGSGKSLGDFKQLFISLGKELPVSTSEVEQAATEMAKGGIDPATIAAGGLKSTIQFAAAALKGDLVGAAEISSKTMQAWTNITDDAKTKTEFLTHAQDLMTQATAAASTTVPELAQGMANAGGTARLMGLSFDETLTTLAQLTPSFASSADAGTSFKVFLSSLLPHTKPAIQAMMDLNLYTKENGSAFFDAQGKFVGMEQAERLLAGATKDLTNEQRSQYLQTIFGTDGIRVADVVARQGAEGYNALKDSISKQSNVAQAAATAQKGYNTALENAKGSVEALQITVGSALIPVLASLLNNVFAPLINKVTDFVTGITNANIPLETLGRIFSGIKPTMQDVAQLFVPLASVFGADMARQILAFGETFSKVTAAAQPLVDIIKNNLEPILIAVGAVITGAVIVALVGLVAPLAAPIAIIAGLIAVGATLIGAWNSDFGGIRTTVTDVFTNTLMPAFQTAATWVGANLPAATQTLSGIWNGVLLPALTAVYSFISGTLIPIIVAIVQVNFAALQVIIAAVSALVSDILVPAFQKAVTWFQQSKTAMDAVKGAGDLAQAAMSALSGAVGWVINALGSLVSQLQKAKQWLDSLKPPDWLVGHSPPPMADWLTDIAKACGAAVDQLVLLKDQLATMKKSTKGVEDALTVVKKFEDELAKMRQEAYDAAAAIASISMGNLNFTYSLGDVSSERNDQKSIADENKKNLEEQKALKAQIQADTQMLNQATDEGTQTSYYDKLVEEQKQLNDLQYQYNFNQAKIAEDQGKINQITQLTTDAQKELAAAQSKAGEYAKVDAKLGQDYYKMESDYIQQLNSLKKKQIEATSADEYQMYAQQIDLLNQQHDAQTSLFGIEAEQRAKELSDMAQAAQDAKNALKGQAYEIAGGIMQGIYDKAADIAQAISDTIIKAIEMAQGALEIGSPSKLTARLLGKPLMQGITQEMMNTDVAGVLSDSLVQPIASAAQIMNQNSGNSYASASTYNYSPVYQSAPNSPQQDFYLMRAGLLPV